MVGTQKMEMSNSTTDVKTSSPRSSPLHQQQDHEDDPQQYSIVDRTIHATFPAEHTVDLPPSSKGGTKRRKPITPELERLHRLHGTSILSHAAILLRLHTNMINDTNTNTRSNSVYATSTTLFHRFYHRKSFTEINVWSVAMASTLLACKIEEVQGRGGGKLLSKDIASVYIHIFRRFRLHLLSTTTPKGATVGSKPSSLLTTARSKLLVDENGKDNNMTLEEKRNILRYIRPMPEDGELYRCWEKEIFDTENLMLRELGFSLYWIPEGHPHVFLLYFLKILEVDGGTGGSNVTGGGLDSVGNGDRDDNRGKRAIDAEKATPERLSVGQIAWNYCNDSCRLDLCVRYPPEVTTCAAIYLACQQKNVALPHTPRPWWQVFIGVERDADLSIVCNALLTLSYDGGEEDDFVEGYRNALRSFLVSLVPKKGDDNDSGGGGGGSFNDPGEGDSEVGFVWNSFD